MALFYGWISTASRLEPIEGGCLLFTIKFPEIAGTHFFYQPLKDEQHKWCTKIWTKEKSIGYYAAKMLLPQLDEGFWLYYTRGWYKNI